MLDSAARRAPPRRQVWAWCCLVLHPDLIYLPSAEAIPWFGADIWENVCNSNNKTQKLEWSILPRNSRRLPKALVTEGRLLMRPGPQAKPRTDLGKPGCWTSHQNQNTSTPAFQNHVSTRSFTHRMNWNSSKNVLCFTDPFISHNLKSAYTFQPPTPSPYTHPGVFS